MRGVESPACRAPHLWLTLRHPQLPCTWQNRAKGGRQCVPVAGTKGLLIALELGSGRKRRKPKVVPCKRWEEMEMWAPCSAFEVSGLSQVSHGMVMISFTKLMAAGWRTPMWGRGEGGLAHPTLLGSPSTAPVKVFSNLNDPSFY